VFPQDMAARSKAWRDDQKADTFGTRVDDELEGGDDGASGAA
jgi:hypothetical protein